MKKLIIFISGFLFACGLVYSGMTNPQKVIGFLDILGDWDYSLAFVMGGAVSINLVLFPLILKRKPLWAKKFYLPIKKEIDFKLITGSALFGIGWGLSGICPGPGIVNIVTLDLKVLAFVFAMVTGMVIYEKLLKGRR